MKYSLSNKIVLRNDELLSDRYSFFRIDNAKTESITGSLFSLLCLLENYNLSLDEINEYLCKIGINQPFLTQLEEMMNQNIIIENSSYNRSKNNYLDFLKKENIEKLAIHGLPITSTPENVEIHLTHRCNLKCLYCAYTSVNKSSDLINKEIWFDVFDQLEEMHVKSIIISGGEPLLYPDICDILEYLQRKKFKSTILSNGILMTDRISQFFVDSNLSITISLDGITKEAHELYRGSGTFHKVINAIETLSKKKSTFYISTVLNSINLNQLTGLIDFSKEKGAKSIAIGKLEMVGNSIKNSVDSLTMNDIKKANETISKIKEKEKDFNIGFRENHFFPDSLTNKHDNINCSAGTSRLTIDSSGDIYPCVLCFNDKEFKVGSIVNERLIDIWIKNTWKLVREKVTTKDLSGCDTCSKQATCTVKNCRLSAHYTFGNYYGKPPFCNYLS